MCAASTRDELLDSKGGYNSLWARLFLKAVIQRTIDRCSRIAGTTTTRDQAQDYGSSNPMQQERWGDLRRRIVGFNVEPFVSSRGSSTFP
jgi:hypothetical protein